MVRFLLGRTIPQKLLRIYLVLVFLGAGLLYSPFALQNGYQIVNGYDAANQPIYRSYYFWDALFISCSSFSDTGLTPAVLSQTFTTFGQIVVYILLQIGGIGIITIIFLVWSLFNRHHKIDINQTVLMQAERGNSKIGSTFSIIKKAVIFIFVTQLIFGVLYTTWFYFVPTYVQVNQVSEHYHASYDSDITLDVYHNFVQALWVGFFTSASAINNTGMDIFNDATSIAALRNDHHTIIQMMILLQIFIGAIGYPVIFEVIEKIKKKRKNIKHNLSLFTKICLWGYLLVSIFALVFSYTSEMINAYVYTENNYSIFLDHNIHNEWGKAKNYNKFFAIFFNTMTTRSCGFMTFDHNIMSLGMKWTNAICMFIGASPSSTAGGIRTTTFVIIVAAIYSRFIGRNKVVLFKRKVNREIILNAFIIFVVSILMVFLCGMVITYSRYSVDKPQYSFIQVIYESASAFGTVGATSGITSDITAPGQIIMILLMFAGQLGLSSTFLAWSNRNAKGNAIEYPEEEVRIG